MIKILSLCFFIIQLAYTAAMKSSVGVSEYCDVRIHINSNLKLHENKLLQAFSYWQP